MAGDGLGGERKVIELFEVRQYFLSINNHILQLTEKIPITEISKPQKD